MSAVLNGSLIGEVTLTGGWNQVLLVAPASAWRIGLNQLELSLSGTTAPAQAAGGDDRRQLSVAIDRIAVREVRSTRE
jgi:hypothetical protein